MNKDYMQYIEVPEEKNKRLKWAYKMLNITGKLIDKMEEEIKKIRKAKKNKEIIEMTFYIVPEGIARPRKGWNGKFYVPNIQKFYDIMDSYIIKHKELENLKIFTEFKMGLKYYLPMPKDMNKVQKILAERKFITNIKKPDWDNLGKGTDMLARIMINDSLATDVRVRKFYSFKPRIEVRLVYYKDHTNSYHKKIIEKLLKKGS